MKIKNEKKPNPRSGTKAKHENRKLNMVETISDRGDDDDEN